jgi:hypothetical protein
MAPIGTFRFACPAIMMDYTYRILSSHIAVCQGTSLATTQMRLPATYIGEMALTTELFRVVTSKRQIPAARTLEHRFLFMLFFQQTT